MDLEKTCSTPKQRSYPVIAFVIPVAIILVLWRIVPGSFQKNENEDYFYFYLPVAQNIVHGNGITLDGKIACGYPPGYPVLIAAVLLTAQTLHVDPEALLRASIAFFLAMSALLVYFIARVLWSPCQAFLTSALWSFYPLILWAAKQQNSELPFMTFFYGALLCIFLGWRTEKNNKLYFFSGGVLCGAAILIRPIGLFTGVLIAVVLLFRKRYRFNQRAAISLLVIAGNLVAVLPWEIWMCWQTHEFGLLCRGRDTISMFDGLTFAVWNPEGYRKGVPVPGDVKKFMEEMIQKYPLMKSTGQVAGLVKAELKSHPLTVIKLFLIKVARSWYGTNSNRLELFIIAVQAIYLVLMALACWRFWKLRMDCRLPLAMCLVLVFYFWGMTVSVLSIVRYMVPVLGLMFIFFPALKPSAVFPPRRPPRANLPPA